ncbi:unnamed protein product [Linum tenue]|uniref:anthocyanidin 3-O-glucosyltransferase n=1 Tax=Linum tenue TaxID=586396 RepID=A0AAV0QD00_9ROSI|nr:unnamed protein product [Linum tenue]
MAIPSLEKPLPCKFLPSVVVEKEWLPLLIDNTRRLREARGIVVNTFLELETYALGSVSVAGNPPVYPVGPLEEEEEEEYKEVMEWLDGQPAGSVVFLCFGSMGSFAKEQATEIAAALERAGHRFLWSLRRPSEMGITGVPGEYENFDDVLPGGFLDRTSGVGKVIGWAPQMAVLGHQSVGGFVSHCGWNSMLESVWFGVPIGAWPMYAEQQLNAFQFVEDLGFAEEIRMDYRWGSGKIIKMDYRWDGGMMVTAEEIEGGIRRLMAAENDEGRKRKTVKEVSEMSKKALTEGGSSCSSLSRFIQDVIDNIS